MPLLAQLPTTGLLEDRFELTGTLGSGGFGVVMSARDIVLGRDVAIKFLRMEKDTEPQLLARFQREAKVLAQLEHENLIAVYSYGIFAEQHPYIVMERAAGTRLRDLVIADSIRDFETLRSIMIQICQGLDYAHRKGVVHRDLTPANICVSIENDTVHVKVIDFGFAFLSEGGRGATEKLTQTGFVVGNLTYMSPEQCCGKTIDGRSDMYSLGAIFYECLSGNCALSLEPDESNLERTILAIISRMASNPTVRPQFANHASLLKAIVLRCLQKSPQDRFSSCAEICECLRLLKEPDPALTSWSCVAPSPGRRTRMHQAGLLAVIAMVLCLVPLGVILCSDSLLSNVLLAGQSNMLRNMQPHLQINLAAGLVRLNYSKSATVFYNLIRSNSRSSESERLNALEHLAQIQLDNGKFESSAQDIQDCLTMQQGSAIGISENDLELADNCLSHFSRRQEPITQAEIYIRRRLLAEAAKTHNPVWQEYFSALQRRISPQSIKSADPKIVKACASAYSEALGQDWYPAGKREAGTANLLSDQLLAYGMANESAVLLNNFKRWPQLVREIEPSLVLTLMSFGSLSLENIRQLSALVPSPTLASGIYHSSDLPTALQAVSICFALCGDDSKAKSYAEATSTAVTDRALASKSETRLEQARLDIQKCQTQVAAGALLLQHTKSNARQWIALDAACRPLADTASRIFARHSLSMLLTRYQILHRVDPAAAAGYLAHECLTRQDEYLYMRDPMLKPAEPTSVSSFPFIAVAFTEALPKPISVKYLKVGMDILNSDDVQSDMVHRISSLTSCVQIAANLDEAHLMHENIDQLLIQLDKCVDEKCIQQALTANSKFNSQYHMLTAAEKVRFISVIDRLVATSHSLSPDALNELKQARLLYSK
jgi:serine/threonine protein kinase